MKNDFPDFNLYASVCASTMGLRWVGLTTERHAPPYTTDPATGRGVFGKWLRREDYSLAEIDAAALISTLELALRGNFTALIHAYARNVTWKDLEDWDSGGTSTASDHLRTELQPPICRLEGMTGRPEKGKA